MKRLFSILILFLSTVVLFASCGNKSEDVVVVVAGGGGNPTGSSPNQYPMGGAIQGKELSLADVATTVAGLSLIGSADGAGTAAKFYYPYGITTDGVNLYVADSNNNTIRKIVISTGAVSTIAGSAGSYGSADSIGTAARFDYPDGITTDGTNLYVVDSGNCTVRKIVILTGAVTTFAGSAGSCGSTDGTGTAARFNYPTGITTDVTNLYVADTGNSTIRKIVILTGAVTTIAGSAQITGATDAPLGPGTVARFNNPRGITTDGLNLYVADTNNSTIRKIAIFTGIVSTIAGSAQLFGSTDAPVGPGTAARFNYPNGVTTDGLNLYVVDSNNNTIRKIVISSGAVSTIAGSGGYGSADGIGTAARFNYPTGITTDGANLYVADSQNSTIRKIVIFTVAVTTIAGSAGSNGSADGTGTAARFNYPSGITTDGANLYVADTNNSTIRKIVISTGAVSTFAGSAGSNGSADGTGTAARYNYPSGITTDGANLYVADTNNSTIRKIVILTGAVSTIAGSGSYGSADGTGTPATFAAPQGITTDGTNLYVADTSNQTIRKIVISSGSVSTIAGSAGLTGSADGTGTVARFNNPVGITTDGTNLYVGDTYNGTIRKIVISTGAVTTLAVTIGTINAQGITTDGVNLYVAGSNNHTIQKIAISTGVVTTIAGMAYSAGSADGMGAAARFYNSVGITTDGTSLYVADSNNNSIRSIR